MWSPGLPNLLGGWPPPNLVVKWGTAIQKVSTDCMLTTYWPYHQRDVYFCKSNEILHCVSQKKPTFCTCTIRLKKFKLKKDWKSFWKSFSWQFQCHPQKYFTIFGFEVISVWIKGVPKKVRKSGLKRRSFCNFCLISLIQTLITSKRKIVEDFRRRH
jgi:hypothetical protein